MLPVALGGGPGRIERLLVVGAHADDIEIGCGGTILRLVEEHPALSVCWLVLSGTPDRAEEARASAGMFLESGAGGGLDVVVESFRDGFLPWSGEAVKEVFERIKGSFSPDVVFTHRKEDAHQDHRLVADLTWNTFRDHLIFEYEIPKYDADLGAPNVFVPLTETVAQRKIDLLHKAFPSQHPRQWFDADAFWSILRLRGLESNSPTRFAEGFHVRKMVLR